MALSPASFFNSVRDSELWPGGESGFFTEVFDDERVSRLVAGPEEGTDDAEVALALLDLAHDELVLYGTSGGQQLDDQEIALVIRALTATAKRVGVSIDVPFRDFTRFRTYWYRKDASGPGGWQARRELLEEIFEDPRQRLEELKEGPVYSRFSAASIASLRDPSAISEQLNRIQRAVVDDPALAIGSAKELVESTAKAILAERNVAFDDADDLPSLVREAQKALSLHPSSSVVGPDGTDAVKKILGSVSGVVIGLAELRNRGYGTGHGAAGVRVGLRSRHAHLAVNASVTWCRLMLDTLADPEAPWRKQASGSGS